MKTYSTPDISNEIKAEALRLGFSACGIAKAEPVSSDVANKYRQWLNDGKHASMQYLERNLEKRLDPTLLLPNAKSIICLALNYYPARLLADQQYQFAYYAYGKDYHEVMKQKIQSLITFMHTLLLPADKGSKEDTTSTLSFKPCCDTVPILDRYWASQAGIGWIGKNGNLIIPDAGSYFFLGEILADIELTYDTPIADHCGSCQKCLNACPTKALEEPQCINACKCLSYLTIEHRGEFEGVLGNTIYGCDCCQKACPWNHFAQPTKIQEFAPSDKFLSMSPADWHNLTIEDYRTLFQGSAVKRTKYEGLMRNIAHLQKGD